MHHLHPKRSATCALSIAFCLSLVLTPASVGALRVPKMPMKDLVANSAAVVIATVVRVDTAAGKGTDECATAVELHVDEVLGGGIQPDSTLTFELPVGELPDGTFLAVPGSPNFEPKESYLLFLRRGEWRLTPVTNWNYGLLRKVAVDGIEYFVDATGRTVTEISSDGFHYGERIARSNELNVFASSADDQKEVTPDLARQRVQTALNSSQLRTDLRRWIQDTNLSTTSVDLHVRFSGSAINHQQVTP